MPTCAISELVTFNLTVLLISVLLAMYLWRRRTSLAAIGGVLLASIASITLILFTQQTSFFLVALGCSVLFLHLPLWIMIAVVLLWRHRRWLSVLGIVLTVFLEVIAFDAFFIEPTWLEVTRYEFTDARIKEPMRIVVIADLQTDHIGDFQRHVLETALQQEPDLILFAGDYFSVRSLKSWQNILEKFQGLVKELEFDAPLGVYAVRGNLDHWTPWPVAFRSMSGKRINGGTKSFEVGDIRLTCLSEWDSFNKALKCNPPNNERFHIVLGHCPNFAMGEVDADLLLAGHTHGGQVRLPIIGTLSTGCQVPRAWAAGMTELPDLKPGVDADRHLIVSRGTGMERGVAPRIRFLCRPELVVIDLKPEKSPQSLQPDAKTTD